MNKINFKNTGVIWTGILTAILQYFIGSGASGGSKGATEAIGAVLTVLVALHGALSSSIFQGNSVTRSADKLVSEGEIIIQNAENGEK